MQDHANIITIRAHTGLSGDMFLTGLAALLMRRQSLQPGSTEAHVWLDGILERVLPELSGCVQICRVERGGIGAFSAQVDLPHEHEHRNLEDINKIIANSGMNEEAKVLAQSCFESLATAEAHVHGIGVNEVHFHEVGALDSILDICATCELFVLAAPDSLVCSPLPLADGSIHCAHGLITAPAPVALELLRGMEIMPFAGAIDSGELVTPTALVLLRAFSARFDGWPTFRLEDSVLVYGQKFFPAVANGTIFALGSADRN